jgi:hypothetical protein
MTATVLSKNILLPFENQKASSASITPQRDLPLKDAASQLRCQPCASA